MRSRRERDLNPRTASGQELSERAFSSFFMACCGLPRIGLVLWKKPEIGSEICVDAAFLVRNSMPPADEINALKIPPTDARLHATHATTCVISLRPIHRALRLLRRSCAVLLRSCRREGAGSAFRPGSGARRCQESPQSVERGTNMAETEGFEPSVGVIPLRRFSKPLVSATHPRLRRRPQGQGLYDGGDSQRFNRARANSLRPQDRTRLAAHSLSGKI